METQLIITKKLWYSFTSKFKSFFTFAGDIYNNGTKSSKTKTVDFVVGEKIDIFVSSLIFKNPNIAGDETIINKNNININNSIKSISKQTISDKTNNLYVCYTKENLKTKSFLPQVVICQLKMERLWIIR